MSEVIQALRNSTDSLENDLADVYDHWQEVKRTQGLHAGLGYEPRDINAFGAIKVISSRVLKASAGFEDVDPEKSYEAIVLRYPDKFSTEVITAAKERLKLGATNANVFKAQDIQFFIKTSSYELFGLTGVDKSVEGWAGRQASIPNVRKEHEYAADFLRHGFRGLIWIHEKTSHGETGKGLTAVVQFGPMKADGDVQIVDVVFFDVPIGKDFLKEHSSLKRMYKYSLTRTWPIDDKEVSDLFTAIRSKIHLFAQYGQESPDPNAALNLEKIEDATFLRQVVLRRYQSAFRQALLAQRPNCCAITGTGEVSVLEAAHIIPYAEKFADRDKPENGLLLRSDIHKLFDAHLISINPSTKTVEVATDIQSPDYLKLNGKKVEDDISNKSLIHHFERFTKQSL